MRRIVLRDQPGGREVRQATDRTGTEARSSAESLDARVRRQCRRE
jgi:hypothetical protein